MLSLPKTTSIIPASGNNSKAEEINSVPSFPMSQFVGLYANFFIVDKKIAMLACQAVDRWGDSAKHLQKSLDACKKNHYRAMLQIFIMKFFGISQTMSVGPVNSDAMTSFQKYVEYSVGVVTKSVKKLAIKNTEWFNNEQIWWSVRGVLATVIESLILIDRILYLNENHIPKTTIVPLFNPSQSPRCFCIIGLK